MKYLMLLALSFPALALPPEGAVINVETGRMSYIEPTEDGDELVPVYNEDGEMEYQYQIENGNPDQIWLINEEGNLDIYYQIEEQL